MTMFLCSHGNNKTGKEVKSVLHPDLKTLPARPEVQLIGNGPVNDENIAPGLGQVQLKHPSHETFHKTVISKEDTGATRFYRWHVSAAQSVKARTSLIVSVAD